MPKIVFTHAVVDVDRWLKDKADRAQLGSNVVDYVAAAQILEPAMRIRAAESKVEAAGIEPASAAAPAERLQA